LAQRPRAPDDPTDGARRHRGSTTSRPQPGSSSNSNSSCRATGRSRAAADPDGHGRLELTTFHTPSPQGGNRHAPANTPGIRHVAFAVEDIDAVVAGLRARGAELDGELERYQDSYRLCYVRGPEGIIVELAEQIG
jgi:catechol 2,3-dioxygenase-like lactoylglutathione lyase family enzyme